MLIENQEIPGTQREIVHAIAKLIYRTHDATLPDDLYYLERSQHPTERAVLRAAEAIFEIFVGDSPDYASNDPEEEE